MKRIPSVLPVAILVATLAATALPANALGQVPAPSSAPVTLLLDLAPGSSMYVERLRDAIAWELGVPVVWQRNADGAVGGYHRDDARALLRSIP